MIEKINNNITYYNYFDIEWGKDSISEEDFDQLEKLLNLKLTSEHKEFLEETNGIYLDDAYFYFKIRGKVQYLKVLYLYGFCKNINYSLNIMKVNSDCLDSLIPNYLAIGEDDIGLIIYNVENKKVQYWDGTFHALDSEYVHIIDLADSLKEFIEKLEPKRSKLKLLAK